MQNDLKDRFLKRLFEVCKDKETAIKVIKNLTEIKK